MVPHGVQTWQIGEVIVSRIIESELAGMHPERLHASLTAARVRQFAWLTPDYADEHGTLMLSVHAFVVESMGRRIIVDTCVGNDKPRENPHWNMLNHPFLENLETAGFAPETIDTVLCTHLHVDHVGWNTRWNGQAWVPTFPGAKYLFARTEWEHWTTVARSGDETGRAARMLQRETVFADSIAPVVDAGLHLLVETDHQITDEVRLVPTPGHTPGHVSVEIRSAGRRAIITGDMLHHPVQIADPDICSNFDSDQRLSAQTRHGFVASHADSDILVLGTHFATPSAGYIVSATGGRRLVQRD